MASLLQVLAGNVVVHWAQVVATGKVPLQDCIPRLREPGKMLWSNVWDNKR